MRSGVGPWLVRWAAVFVVVLAAESAYGYTIESPLSSGCHERITEDALRAVRASGRAEPLPPRDDDERALLKDLPFELPDDMHDVGSAALLFGVRLPDILEHSDVDVTALALVHGDPNRQDDHCLRAPADDEPQGALGAIAACQASARASLARAAGGLLEDGSVDPDAYDSIEVTLPVRSRTDVRLNRFYVNVGTALHTLQDAFSHSFRDDGVVRVTTALNWIDYVERHGREDRDGPEHRAELDACVHLDARRRERLSAAVNASVEVLSSMLQDDPALRLDAAAAAFARTTQVDESCSFTNNWCASADARYATGAGCAQAGGTPLQVLVALLVLGRFTWGKKCASTRRRLPR